jgi:eukaryotic-like serine/threonine-protein kinase
MPEDDPKVITIFTAALERIDPAARASFLDSACGADDALRHRVEALLATHDGGGRPVEEDTTGMFESTSPETMGAPADSDLETLPPSTAATGEVRTDGEESTFEGDLEVGQPGGSGAGQVIAGRYTLLEILGEGGMGTVYRASQTAPVKRQVALKLIKIGMDSRAVLARFDAERQALALMDHPNIARVFDGGTTEAGQPFFVMELVSGEPITEYCDRKRLRVQARLELFVNVCQAVQHAHQKGIIHRDLKPSNVMVTELDGRPTPKVIDFGVAKATEFSLTDFSLGDTGAIVGTPTYMSPEQADPSSMDIDTRTDVYALGVILYELLAGAPPLDAKQSQRGAILEMLRMVREVDPPNPSTKVSTAEDLPNIAATRDVEPAQLKRALRGDLDWIAMKALEKDRTRRYETANGLAADVLRHLAHEPVVAAPPSGFYRLRKFVRKNRGAVIAANLVLLSLLGGLGAVLEVQRRANRVLMAKNNDVDQANTELTRSRAAVQERYELAADAIKTFHTGVSEDFLLKQNQFKALRDRLLRSASHFYGRLSALLDKGTDVASRWALADSNFELAELTNKVGDKAAALAAHRAVLAAREALAAEPGSGSGILVEVCKSLAAMAELFEMMGKTHDAVTACRRSESLLAGPAASDPAVRVALANCRSRLGYFLSRTGRSADALAACRLARAEQEVLAAGPDASNKARRDLATTVELMGSLLMESGKLTETETEFRTALAVRQGLVRDNPAVTEFRHELERVHNRLGVMFSQMGKRSEAEAEYRTALAILQKLADENPGVTEFRRNLAINHNNLGLRLRHDGKQSEAEAEFRAALAIRQELVRDNPAAIRFRHGLGLSHQGLGNVLRERARWAEAEAEFCTALTLLQKVADEDPTVTEFRFHLGMIHRNLGDVLRATGRSSLAEAEFRTALALAQQIADDNPANMVSRWDLGAAHTELGLQLARDKRLPEAFTALDAGRAIFQKQVDADPQNGAFLNDLGQSTADQGRIRVRAEQPAMAVPDLRRALEIWAKVASPVPATRFERVRVLALLAGLGQAPKSGVTAAEGAAFADQAVAALRDAINSGWAARDELKEPDFDPLRKREDFQKLIAELEKPPPTQSEKKP